MNAQNISACENFEALSTGFIWPADFLILSETQRFSNSLEGSQYLVTETCYGMLPISLHRSPAFVYDCLTVLWQLQKLLLWKGDSWKVFNLSLAVF